jgi:hypothetical protein
MDKSIKFQDALIDYIAFTLAARKAQFQTLWCWAVSHHAPPRTIGGHYFFSKTKQKSVGTERKNNLVIVHFNYFWNFRVFSG